MVGLRRQNFCWIKIIQSVLEQITYISAYQLYSCSLKNAYEQGNVTYDVVMNSFVLNFCLFKRYFSRDMHSVLECISPKWYITS